MAVQLAALTRNAKLDAIETEIGTSAVLRLRTGAQPANVATADSGTVLAVLTLPSDWMAAAAAGVKGKAGTWSDIGVGGGGTIGHFRIYTSGGTAKMQGSVGLGSGDLSLDNNVIADSQVVTVTQFDLTEGNA
jgi:hypothetical protein